ncbi:MAG: hypothetical protein IPN71_08815 [Fibrobacteres bacterium]|nr:hypothetical protein [Fibrobacterota bacterium]
MSNPEAYKQKVEAELELIHAKTSEFKAHAKIAVATTTRIQAQRHHPGPRAERWPRPRRLAELNASSDNAWETIKSRRGKGQGRLADGLQRAKGR